MFSIKKTNCQTDFNKLQATAEYYPLSRHAWARYYRCVGIDFRKIPCRETSRCASRRPLLVHAAKWHFCLPSESQLNSKLFSGADRRAQEYVCPSMRSVISCIFGVEAFADSLIFTSHPNFDEDGQRTFGSFKESS